MFGKKEKITYLAFILPKAISIISGVGFKKSSETSIRDLAKNLEQSNVNHRASFAGMTGKVVCIKVPRSTIPKECVDEVDKRRGKQSCIIEKQTIGVSVRPTLYVNFCRIESS